MLAHRSYYHRISEVIKEREEVVASAKSALVILF